MLFEWDLEHKDLFFDNNVNIFIRIYEKIIDYRLFIEMISNKYGYNDNDSCIFKVRHGFLNKYNIGIQGKTKGRWKGVTGTILKWKRISIREEMLSVS